MTRQAILVFSIVLVAVIAAGFTTNSFAAPQAQLNIIPTPTPGPDGRIIYIAQEGDNIYRIAAIAGISAEEFRKLNPFINGDIIIAGQKYLIGYAGPASGATTTGPFATQPVLTPSPTSSPGSGILCVLLYNDLNGDSMRQESEPSILGGEISVSNRSGTVSLTGQTPSGGIATNIVNPTPLERGYVCFDHLMEGEYLISVAAPQGYNRTTALNASLQLEAGQTTEIAFGAQADSELEAQTAIIPESPHKSPMLGIIGGIFLIGGIALGVYAALLRRAGASRSG